MEIHGQFIIKALQYAETDERILGMAVGGSWKLKNHQPPRGVWKVEMLLAEEDLEALRNTLPTYSREGLLTSLSHSIHLYQSLRQ